MALPYRRVYLFQAYTDATAGTLSSGWWGCACRLTTALPRHRMHLKQITFSLPSKHTICMLDSITCCFLSQPSAVRNSHQSGPVVQLACQIATSQPKHSEQCISIIRVCEEMMLHAYFMSPSAELHKHNKLFTSVFSQTTMLKAETWSILTV